MAATTLKRKLQKLEARARAAILASLDAVPAMTPQQARERMAALAELAQARRAEIDAALASGDRRRRAWARQRLRERESPRSQMIRAAVQAKLAAIQARRDRSTRNVHPGATS